MRSWHRLAQHAKTIGLVIASLVVSVLLGELLLRSWYKPDFLQSDYPPWPFHAADPGMGFVLKPGHQSDRVSINSLGLRGPAITQAKPAAVIRIVCLGDSSTFGITRRNAFALDLSSYPQHLQHLVDAAGLPVEVINAGVIGYTSNQGLRQLHTRLAALQPDIVTLRFGMNDHGWRHPASQPQEPRNTYLRRLFYRLYHWRISQLSLAAYQHWQLRSNNTEMVRAASIEQFTRNLQGFIDASKQYQFKLLLMDYPLREQSRGLSPNETADNFPAQILGANNLAELHEVHNSYQQAQQQFATAWAIPLLHTGAQLHSLQPPGFGDWDMIHPSAAGKQKTAELLFQRLQQLGWLNRPH